MRAHLPRLLNYGHAYTLQGIDENEDGFERDIELVEQHNDEVGNLQFFVALFDGLARCEPLFADAGYGEHPGTMEVDPQTGYVHMFFNFDEQEIIFRAFETVADATAAWAAAKAEVEHDQDGGRDRVMARLVDGTLSAHHVLVNMSGGCDYDDRQLLMNEMFRYDPIANVPDLVASVRSRWTIVDAALTAWHALYCPTTPSPQDACRLEKLRTVIQPLAHRLEIAQVRGSTYTVYIKDGFMWPPFVVHGDKEPVIHDAAFAAYVDEFAG
jgi:hypothetical protein